MNRTILERARSLLLGVGVDRSFWAEVVNTATYLVNRSPTTAIDLKYPEEVWTGKEPDLSHLKVFGSVAYFKVDAKSKLDARWKKGIFLGYGDGVKGYRIYDPEAKRCYVKISSQVPESLVKSLRL